MTSAEIIQFGEARQARQQQQAEQQEREDAARGGYFTRKELAAIYQAAPLEQKWRLQRLLEDAQDEPPKQLPPPSTITAKNSRLRAARVEAWRSADAARRYWEALLHLTDAASIASRYGLKEAGAQDVSHEDRWSILEAARAALGRQLLTPAPDMAAVIWKRQQLKRDPYLGADKRDVERAIAKDAAFLEAHPTRKSRDRPTEA